MEKFLIPAKGLVVRDPRTMSPLANKGELKPWIGPEGRYWRRRVTCGDVILREPPVVKIESVKTDKKNKNSNRVSE